MRKLIFLFCVLALSSCYKDPFIEGQFSDEFYVRNAEVDMPVWVRGNSDANAFLIFVNGGPLLSGIEVAIADDFSQLHEDYAIVYYDQRGGGFSHGNRKKNLNEDQMVEDLDAVVDFIRFQYGEDKSIFLMGHSWGGYLGSKYLTDIDRQAKVNGWITLAGAHNFELNWQASREFVIDFSLDKIDNNEDEDGFWQQAISDLSDLDKIDTHEQVLQVNWRAQRIDGEVNSASNLPTPSYFDWAISPAGIGTEQKDLLDLEAVLVSGNLSEEMILITLPSLLIYGAKDAIVPAVQGEKGYELLGTPEVDKKLVILENSGHEMWRLQTEDFVREVVGFVEMYK